jgi:anti-sigma regulatory factor (Ser/Thr protein kinase)
LNATEPRYDSVVVSIDLPPERSAASRARRFVREQCERWHLRPAVIDDIELLVSELVTNAVLHARSGARVKVDHMGDRVRVTVEDESPVFPRLREYGPDAVTGRGVFLVDRLSDDWGVEAANGDAGKGVWFEVAVAAKGERSRA